LKPDTTKINTKPAGNCSGRIPAAFIANKPEIMNNKKLNNDADLNDDDLEALGDPNLSMDGGDDEQLKQRTHAADFSGEDLDVPGSEDDDTMEEIGSEDEENNIYSIGGDNHEDLEEDPNRI
jgi:hypothetical protein